MQTKVYCWENPHPRICLLTVVNHVTRSQVWANLGSWLSSCSRRIYTTPLWPQVSFDIYHCKLSTLHQAYICVKESEMLALPLPRIHFPFKATWSQLRPLFFLLQTTPSTHFFCLHLSIQTPRFSNPENRVKFYKTKLFLSKSNYLVFRLEAQARGGTEAWVIFDFGGKVFQAMIVRCIGFCSWLRVHLQLLNLIDSSSCVTLTANWASAPSCLNNAKHLMACLPAKTQKLFFLPAKLFSYSPNWSPSPWRPKAFNPTAI